MYLANSVVVAALLRLGEVCFFKRQQMTQSPVANYLIKTFVFSLSKTHNSSPRGGASMYLPHAVKLISPKNCASTQLLITTAIMEAAAVEIRRGTFQPLT